MKTVIDTVATKYLLMIFAENRRTIGSHGYGNILSQREESIDNYQKAVTVVYNVMTGNQEVRRGNRCKALTHPQHMWTHMITYKYISFKLLVVQSQILIKLLC